MKKYIVLLLFLTIYSTTDLRAAGSASPKDYLKRENYEIIEIDTSRYPYAFSGYPTINENGMVLSNEEDGPPIYFNPLKRKIIQCDSLLNEAARLSGINDKNQICGSIYKREGHIGFVWSIDDDKLEFFGGYAISRIFNDGSCITDDGWKVDTEGNAESIHSRYFLLANKNGQYPSEEFIKKASKMAKKAEPFDHMYPHAYNSKGQLLFSTQKGELRFTFLSDSNKVQQLTNPLGNNFYVLASSLNDHGVVAGSLYRLQDTNFESRACLWYKDKVYFLNDVFGKDYSSVAAINNRCDMVVQGKRHLHSPAKVYVFLRKHSKK